MGLFAQCPLPTALTAIGTQNCAFLFGQISRIAFQRPQTTAPFPTLTTIQTKSNWDTLIAATDNTKIVLSPLTTSIVIPRSEGQYNGGNDNSTFNGIAEYGGEGFVRVTGQLKNTAPAVARALDALSAESLPGSTGGTNLTAFLFTSGRQIIAENPTSTTTYRGVRIYNFRRSSIGSEGFNSSNIIDISFDLAFDWDRQLAIVTPTFDPLTEI